MIVDTSALVALLLNEPERYAFSRAIGNADNARLSAGSLLELSVVVQRRKIASPEQLEALLAAMELRIEPVTVEQAAIGVAAYREYGQSSGHRARLNYGDCFAYALAKATGEPLLFKGDDFVHTDVLRA
jgi:ribonuclease VapC